MRGCQGCCRFAGHIRGMLPSVSRSLPLGAIMVLEVGGETKFHPRLVEGVSLPNGVEPDVLLVDGQQRLTSLFQATTCGRVVSTMNIRKQPVQRWFKQAVEKVRHARSNARNLTSRSGANARPPACVAHVNPPLTFPWPHNIVSRWSPKSMACGFRLRPPLQCMLFFLTVALLACYA